MTDSPAYSGRLLNRHVVAVIENEWSQLARSKVVIFTTLAPPLLLVVLALCILFITSWISSAAVGVSGIGTPLTGGAAAPGLAGLNDVDKIRGTLLSPFLLLFQMIPLVVPVTIATYGIVGEKQSHSLEAVLATPIRTWELLLAKALSAAIPGILVTWCSFAVFALAGRFIVSDAVFRQLIVAPTWIVSIVLLTPLLTLMAVCMGIIISSRVKDAHGAQQLGSLVVLPLVGLLTAQILGSFNLSLSFVMMTALAVAVLDAGLLGLAVPLFRRESILTTWR